MNHVISIVLIFTVLLFAFNPTGEPPTFGEVFDFGYDVVIKPLEVLASIKDGFDSFVKNLIEWFEGLF